MNRSKRRTRRAHGRAKEEAVLRQRYPNHRVVRGPVRLAATKRDLKATLEFLGQFETAAIGCDGSMLLDLYGANVIDAAACVLLAAAIQRCRLRNSLDVKVRMPRNGSARFALAVFGVADDERIDQGLLHQVEPQVMKVTSGIKGDPSPGERTFEVARLAEGLVADQTLADRVHAALNEAADNVLSWAYGTEHTSPDAIERWWVAGVLFNKKATFIALDHGLGIPATAPQNLGDALSGLLKTMIEDRVWKSLKSKPADYQILQATIHQRRTVSRLEERGKGLNNMIALIDLFASGFINIFSGDAVYAYQNPAGKDGQQETCIPLGVQFPGTMIVWQLNSETTGART